ncbi:MAG: right-handed parallel beta-helix repeat-containing protein [Cyclobacteriaceae bacterium]
MKSQIFITRIRFSMLLIALFISELASAQTRFDVASESEFFSAREEAVGGDSIVWKSGTYRDVFMVIETDSLVVTAEEFGSVIFSGWSKVEINADHVVLSGLQFIGGDIGTDHVIRNWGSDVLITEINIEAYHSYKYLIVDQASRRTTISYCNFESRINLADQNILSILVDDEPGYHVIQYCSFKNFDGSGGDMGIEPIRIGVSSQAHLDSRTIVEYCYFYNCDGDGEAISNKAAQNVFRYNTFINNYKAELVLRHGDEAVVYGNFFLDGMGGVRVREGQNHFIYNNYFSGLSGRSIYLQNESSDQLDSIHIYFNTIIDSEKVRLGGPGNAPPKNVVFANNIFTDPKSTLFGDPTGNERWLGNIASGNLGIDVSEGMTEIDPKLVENDSGYLQLDESSAAIDAAVSGYPPIPEIEGLEFDDLRLDLMQQIRPDAIESKDLGASEYSITSQVSPHAKESNTGPTFPKRLTEFSISTTVLGEGSISISPQKDSYLLGEIVTLSATATDGYQFARWSGDISSRRNPKTIAFTRDLNVVAEFEESLPPPPMDPLEVNDESTVKVYPNPTSDILYLKLPKNRPSELSIFIYDIRGKINQSQRIVTFQDSLEIDISNLSPGLYFLAISSSESKNLFDASKMIKIVKD